jgi:hypothetical protein
MLLLLLPQVPEDTAVPSSDETSLQEGSTAPTEQLMPAAPTEELASTTASAPEVRGWHGLSRVGWGSTAAN